MGRGKHRRRRHHKRRRKHRMPWTEAHVRRVFWRAGFGATAEEAQHFAGAGRSATIRWLVDGDGPAELHGPAPSADGEPLDPVNEFGHDVLWWMDRMVRSTRPLEEKLTLFWHDHFATRDQDQPLMLAQNKLLREHALGRFDDLLREVTLDPAMQLWLTLAGSHKDAPNENYARELMELFTLGTGYTEDDVREAARALTGFVAVVKNGRTTGVRYDASRHDDGAKTIFGQTGNFGWEDVLRLCTGHPTHARFLVAKLWDYFAGAPLDAPTRRKLVSTYRKSGMSIAAVVRKILVQPALYADLKRPDMIKWPVVYVTGTIRQAGGAVDRSAWTGLTALMGQRLFAPPSVAGWDWGAAWLSTNTMRARFEAANAFIEKGGPAEVRDGTIDPGFDPD